MPTVKKCCIDSCVWVKYAGHFKTATLLKYIAENNLLAEINEALISGFGFSIHEADKIITLISSFIIATPRNVFRLSNDPKDNFLYDICI